jgi:WhiB family redox-sensing transcriptional regulator
MGSIKNKLTAAERKQQQEELSMEILSTWNLKNKTSRWKEDARCGDTNATDLFFPSLGDNKKQIAEAKKICGLCTVRKECLAYAQDNMFRYGIWGGKSSGERLKLLGLTRWPIT